MVKGRVIFFMVALILAFVLFALMAKSLDSGTKSPTHYGPGPNHGISGYIIPKIGGNK